MPDEWGAPSSSDTPQRPANGTAALVKRLTRIEREFRDVKNELLKAAGISVEPDLLRVLGSLAVDGDLDLNGSGLVAGSLASADGAWELDGNGSARFDGDTDIGGTLGVTGATTLGGATTISGDTDVSGSLDVTGDATFGGDTTIGGNASITGTLSLPAGIIDNDALASPVTGDTGNASTGVAVPYGTGGTLAAAFSFTVPAGFSEARVMAVSGVALAADSTCIAQTHIGGVSGDDMPIITGGGAAAFSRTITGLTGGAAITVATRVRSFTGTSSAYVITSATVTYLR